MTEIAATPTDSPRPNRSKGIGFWLVIAAACTIAAFVALGLLATREVPNVIQKFAKSSREKAKVDITAIESALEEYSLSNGGRFPDSLVLLVTPDIQGYTYLKGTTVPKDPWGRTYLYEPPGPGTLRPSVLSYGKDGRPGGDGDDADIDSSSLVSSR